MTNTADTRRFRGKNKKPAWQRAKDAPVSVIRLPLVVADPHTRRRLEQLFGAMWQLKRALQQDARARVDAYWAGIHRRQQDPKQWRAELGLSREALERTAYQHLEASGWLGHHATKALAMHQADEVWTAVDRHLFPDATGQRAGRPRVGHWWDYTRIPGRARSHTKLRKWETFRLHGTLTGHLAAYRHSALPADSSPAQAAAFPAGTSVLAQPRQLPVPVLPSGRTISWWNHTGPLVVVFSGGPASIAGDLVLPVRLPQGAGRWPYLAYYLDRPETWHKLDLVRRRNPSAPGGWTYEAHLLTLGAGYASSTTQARREQAAALGRTGGVDGNVTNLSVVSLPNTLDPADDPVIATRIIPSGADRAALERERRKARGRQRALDRSRRNTNRDQYQLSRRQQRRAARRNAAGLPEKTVGMPKGPRVTNAAGVPRIAYRKDRLSNTYRRTRAAHARAAASTTQAKAHRARTVATQITATHGANLTVEDTDIRTWFRLWGKACTAFTPGMLIIALDRECAQIPGGRLLRASTRPTAWSQHCLCGARVAKSLRDRIHTCLECGLTGDRDKVSAALGAFTVLDDPIDPSTARVDYASARHAQVVFGQGLQEALTESTATTRPAPSGRGDAAAHHRQGRTFWRRRAAARRSAGQYDVPTPDEPQSAALRAGTTPDRHACNPDCLVDIQDSS